MKKLLVDFLPPSSGSRFYPEMRAGGTFADDHYLPVTYPALFIEPDAGAEARAAAIAALDAEVVSRDAAAAIVALDAESAAHAARLREDATEAIRDYGASQHTIALQRQAKDLIQPAAASSRDPAVLEARKRAWTAADILANP